MVFYEAAKCPGVGVGEDFWGLKFSILDFLWVGTFLASIFWVARVSGGRGWGVFETNVSIFRVLSFTSVNAFWTLLGLANSAWDFLCIVLKK